MAVQFGAASRTAIAIGHRGSCFFLRTSPLRSGRTLTPLLAGEQRACLAGSFFDGWLSRPRRGVRAAAAARVTSSLRAQRRSNQEERAPCLAPSAAALLRVRESWPGFLTGHPCPDQKGGDIVSPPPAGPFRPALTAGAKGTRWIKSRSKSAPAERRGCAASSSYDFRAALHLPLPSGA